MSMMKTLAKVAIGVAVAKGVSGMMKKSGTTGGTQASRRAPTQAGQGGLFGGAYSPGAQQQAPQGAGLEDLLGSLLGGQQASGSQPASGGGLGGLLEALAGDGPGAGGGYDSARSQSAGGMNDLMSGLVGDDETAAAPSFGDDEEAPAKPKRGFGDLLNQAIAVQNEPEEPPSRDQEKLATLMLRAMIMAMKADGEIDGVEQQKLMSRLGDASKDEQQFVLNEMRKPLDANSIVRDTPKGLERQVYVMSVMGIDLDNQKEAEYLHSLASGMGITPDQVNAIHDQMGVPQIYA